MSAGMPIVSLDSFYSYLAYAADDAVDILIIILGCVSLGESENGFVIRDHMDSSTPKKRKIRKRIILS